jgi:type I restriction enzyme, S subunit
MLEGVGFMTQNKCLLGYRTSALDIIPDTWDCLPLSSADIFVIDGDRGDEYPKQHEFADNGYCLFLSAANVTKYGFVFEDCQFISKEKDSKLRKGKLVKRDIVITTRGTVGNIAIFDVNVPYENIRINSGMAIIRSKETLICSEFLQVMLISDIIQNQIKRFSFGSAQPQLTISIINDLVLSIPSLDEQKAIVDVLSHWCHAIDYTERLITTKQAHRKWLMQQLLTGKHRAPGFSKKWVAKCMKDLVEPILRPVPKPTEAYKALGIRSHCKGTFERLVSDPNTVDMDELFIAKKGDLIVNITFAWEGAIAFVPEEHDGNLVSHRFPTYKLKENEVDADFLRYMVIQPRFIFTLVLISPGGAGRNRVMSKRDFLDIELSVPCLEEQRRIGKILKLADEEITLLSKQCDALKEQKKGLMQQLLTGKVRVTV